MQKIAFITGVTGQTGSYLAELLLSKDYKVHGMIRRSSSFNTARVMHIYENPNFKLHYGDLADGTGLHKLVSNLEPDEVYNLGAMSHVRVSFDQPIYTADVDAVGVLRLLESVRELSIKKQVKFYQASSSEVFGSIPPPQNELTPFHPRSPYGCAKAFAYWQTVNYREAYNLFACNGILFNHEGPRRGETFVTRKITRAATRIKLGLQDKLELGNLDAQRDWGYAGDYCIAMWMMLQHNKPDDYVVSTGEMHTIREFLDITFSSLGLDWQKHVIINKRLLRPSEVDALCGDSSKIRSTLGWKPTIDFNGLIKLMVDSDMQLAINEKILKGV